MRRFIPKVYQVNWFRKDEDASCGPATALTTPQFWTGSFAAPLAGPGQRCDRSLPEIRGLQPGWPGHRQTVWAKLFAIDPAPGAPEMDDTEVLLAVRQQAPPPPSPRQLAQDSAENAAQKGPDQQQVYGRLEVTPGTLAETTWQVSSLVRPRLTNAVRAERAGYTGSASDRARKESVPYLNDDELATPRRACLIE